MEEEELTVQLGATYSCKRKDGTYRDGEVVKLRMNKRARREEYLVHYVGLTRRQDEWVDKTRLVLSKPMKEEDVENAAEQKISEDDVTTQNPRREEDEPETKKVKVETSGTVCKDEEQTCLLCREFCEEPVVIECGHSFCRNCIDKALASRDSFLCPNCEKVTTAKKLATKLALAAISKTSVDATATLVHLLEKVKAQSLVICPEHDEKLKLFCKDDGTLGCIICRDALKHSGHKFLPVMEAVEVYRAELPKLVSPLEEALKEASELSNQQSKMIEQLQNTITECRQHIMSEFGNLYNFLKERREKLLEQLKEQSQCLLEEMKTNTAKMDKNRDSLKETIAVAHQKVHETDVIYFLDGIKDIVTKCREQQEAVTSSSNITNEKQLSQATFKSPIQYFTWKQMKSVVPATEIIQQPKPPEEIHMECGPANAPVQPLSVKKADAVEGLVDPPVPKDPATEIIQQPKPPEQIHKECGPANAPVQPLSVKKADAAKGLVDPSVPKDPGSIQIWIVGDGFMNSIKSEVEASPLGLNFGFPREICNIHWWMECETWLGLFPKLKTSAASLGKPDVMLFHLGSKDLHSVELQTVINRAQDCFNDVLCNFPNIKMILSTLLPKPESQDSRAELRRKGFNYALIFRSRKPPYNMLRHEELEKKLIRRYATGNHNPLTEAEREGFLQSIKDLLEQKVLKDWKPSVARCKLLTPGQVPSEKVQSRDTVKGPNQPFASKQGKSGVTITGKDLQVIVRVEAPVASANPPVTGKDQQVIVRVEAPVASANPPGPKEIWIIGNSYIFRASKHADMSNFGNNLGFDEQQWVVRWMRTIRQFTLQNDLYDANRNLGMPSIVFLHVGSNDLGIVPYNTLIDDFTYDISNLAKLYPQTQFIFSAILPRPEWMYNSIESIRRRFNTAICAYAKTRGFKVTSNSKLEQMLLDRFYTGRTYGSLCSMENEIFISSIKLSIQEAMLTGSRPVTENKEPQKEVLSTGDTLIVVVPGADPAASTKDDDEAIEEKTSDIDPAASREEDKEEVGEKASDADSSTYTEEEDKSVEEETSDCLQPMTKVETPEGSVAPPVDNRLPSDSESKQIWIVGNSYICRAAQQASGGSYGFNLGFKPRNWSVHWMGRISMHWEDLLSELTNALSILGAPNIVFIHLGDSDVGSMPFDALTNTIEHDLSQITTQFPTTEFVFSTMLPKAEWLTNSLEQRRQDFNSALVRYAEELGFHVAVYEGIEESAIPRFKNGGSNVISDAEYDLFVKSIKDALEMIVLKLEKAKTA